MSSPLYAFGAYELDHELRLNGKLVPLEPLHLLVLRALVEAGGELVTRESLESLWTTTVPHEASVSTTILKVRRAVGQGIGHTRPIEVLYKRGWRFHGASRVMPRPQASQSVWRMHLAEAVASGRSDEQCIAYADKMLAAESARFSSPG